MKHSVSRCVAIDGSAFCSTCAAFPSLLGEKDHPPTSSTGAQGSPAGVQTTPQNVPSRTGLSHGHTQLDHRPSQRSGSPIGLAKWFGSDVLQQPLPSMPSKVISVDELEYRQ